MEEDPFDTREFVHQLHSKRYEFLGKITEVFGKATITLNGGGLALVVSGEIFGGAQTSDVILVALGLFAVGLGSAFFALGQMYFFVTSVLDDPKTYFGFQSGEVKDRLDIHRKKLRRANWAFAGSILAFLCGTLTTGFALMEGGSGE